MYFILWGRESYFPSLRRPGPPPFFLSEEASSLIRKMWVYDTPEKPGKTGSNPGEFSRFSNEPENGILLNHPPNFPSLEARPKSPPFPEGGSLCRRREKKSLAGVYPQGKGKSPSESRGKIDSLEKEYFNFWRLKKKGLLGVFPILRWKTRGGGRPAVLGFVPRPREGVLSLAAGGSSPLRESGLRPVRENLKGNGALYQVFSLMVGIAAREGSFPLLLRRREQSLFFWTGLPSVPQKTSPPPR